MKLRNNKGKAAGSGTVSNARRERYRKACEERDKFLETSTDMAKAKELQRANQKKPVGDGAASSMEVKDEKKREEIAPCQKEQEAAPCQKEQGSAPCQKEQAKVEGKREEAAPCQKEQTKKQQEVDVKVEEKKRDAPCQKEQTKKEGEAPAPCQKELGPSSSQVELEKKAGAGKGSKRSQQERKKGEFLSVPQALPAPAVPGLHRPKGQKLQLHLQQPLPKLLVKRKLQKPLPKLLVKRAVPQGSGSGSVMGTGGSPRIRPRKGLPLTTTRP